MNRYTLFISDLHLSESTPEIAQAFLSFLQTHQGKVHALYILGDFFEVWLGDDDGASWIAPIKAALQSFTQEGSQLFFMHGNRDFLLGEAFAHSVGGTLLPEDSYVLNLYGRKILVLHGDTLCTDDVAYQNFRKQMRHPMAIGQFLQKSLPERQQIAAGIRAQAQAASSQKEEYIMDVNDKAVEEEFAKQDVTWMIHGHTHRPNMHSYPQTGQEPRLRIVLDTWERGANCLMVSTDRFEFKK